MNQYRFKIVLSDGQPLARVEYADSVISAWKNLTEVLFTCSFADKIIDIRLQ